MNATKLHDRKAESLELNKASVVTDFFDLAMYQKPVHLHTEQLHIYIDGDGKPWIDSIYVNGDPTPVRSTVLSLIAKDPYPAVYLGRPCYHHGGRGRNCEEKWWTSHRYSEAVVNAMADAVAKIATSYEQSKLVLIGFSGGATLATLLSHRLQKVHTLVTINGNLDTDAWTQHHGYSTLMGSINPSVLPQLPPSIRKMHLVGVKDSVVPPSIRSLENFVDQENTSIYRYPNFTHHCCWPDIWFDFLSNHIAQ